MLQEVGRIELCGLGSSTRTHVRQEFNARKLRSNVVGVDDGGSNFVTLFTSRQ
jgi:hypothetical protein